MLTELGLKNFKCFKIETRVSVGSINLFTGINGRGKSTSLQALLLMRQSPEHSRTTDQVVFNGSCVALGNFDDVRNSAVSQTEDIELMFKFQEGANHVNLRYCLRKNHDDDMVADIAKIVGGGKRGDEEFTFHIEREDDLFIVDYNEESRHYVTQWDGLFPIAADEKIDPVRELIEFTKTHYVSADRIGPQDYYAKQSFAEFPNVGRAGEYTANVLSKKKDELVYDQLCLDRGETRTVLDQTEAWLGTIFEGGRIKIEAVEANIVLMKMNSEDSIDVYKPVNVGFGCSYALPIIVSGLIAQAGELLIVENPEAHLHPFAQSQLTRFLSMVSTCGVQVFIESHSEHVLNSLRISVLEELISSENLNVLYFQGDESSPIIEIPVHSDGSIENWPSGFFDQTDRDFERLFGV